MAKKKRRRKARKTTKRRKARKSTKRKKRTSAKGKIPLKILEHRARRLVRLVKSRGGSV